MWADLVIHLGPAIKKESLDHTQRGGGQFLEDPEPETLSDGRADTVEDRAGSRTFHPLGTAVGEQTAPGLRESGTRLPFRSLQTP